METMDGSEAEEEASGAVSSPEESRLLLEASSPGREIGCWRVRGLKNVSLVDTRTISRYITVAASSA